MRNAHSRLVGLIVVLAAVVVLSRVECLVAASTILNVHYVAEQHGMSHTQHTDVVFALRIDGNISELFVSLEDVRGNVRGDGDKVLQEGKALLSKFGEIKVTITRKDGSVDHARFDHKGQSFISDDFTKFKTLNGQDVSPPEAILGFAQILDYVMWDIPRTASIGDHMEYGIRRRQRQHMPYSSALLPDICFCTEASEKGATYRANESMQRPTNNMSSWITMTAIYQASVVPALVVENQEWQKWTAVTLAGQVGMELGNGQAVYASTRCSTSVSSTNNGPNNTNDR